MERKIGEVFEYNDEWYQCISNNNESCTLCDMDFDGKCPISVTECDGAFRSDDNYVCFKKLEKVGDPCRSIGLGMPNGILVQLYKTYIDPIRPYEANTMIDILNEHLIAIEIHQIKEDMKEQETKSLPIPEGWEFAGYENGEVKIRRVEPELPTTYEDAVDAINYDILTRMLVPQNMSRPVIALCNLLVCRNAWWQKLGWKPDFRSAFVAKYIIENCEGRITTGISGVSYAVLAFPTEEVRDKFAETFKDLIEEAKELL